MCPSCMDSSTKMAIKQGTACFLTFVMFTLTSVSLGAPSRCSEGYFLDSSLQCQKCRECPTGMIVRLPCTASNDTQCFIFTYSPVSGQGTRQLNITVAVNGGKVLDTNQNDRPSQPDSEIGILHKDKVNLKETKESRDGKIDHGITGSRKFVASGSGSSSGSDVIPSVQDPSEEKEQWKILALALIVVLCIVCLFLIIFVAVICVIKSSRSHLKQVLYSAGKT